MSGKRCNGCGLDLLPCCFYVWTRKSKKTGEPETYLSSRCKPCTREQDKKRGPSSKRDRGLRSNYGITLGDYMKMYEDQDGQCYSCGDNYPSEGKNGLVVDHNHETGKVRALLCKGCNTALGSLKEDVTRLNNLIAYITQFSKQEK